MTQEKNPEQRITTNAYFYDISKYNKFNNITQDSSEYLYIAQGKATLYLFDFNEAKESSLFLICRRASNDMDQFCGKVS